MKTYLTFILTGALLVSSSAFAGTTEIGSGSVVIKCRTDISNLLNEDSSVTVELKLKENGKLSANVNGATYNSSIQPIEYQIGKNILTMDTDGPEFSKLNDGELRLMSFKQMMDALPGVINLSFDLSQVTKVIAYDLEGDSNTNKFGGAVLLEAFDSNGALLGRLLSSMLPGQCI
ncbi:MAG: hypothetical protein ACKOX6_18735 [Bdellovibrio sp.]